MLMQALGARATGARLERMQRSPQWRDGHFDDVVPRRPGGASVYAYLRGQIGVRALRDWLLGGSKYRIPKQAVPMQTCSRSELERAPETGLRITWLGHSTTLIEIDGARILIDPVLGPYSGPTRACGQRRFLPLPLAAAELPAIDAVVISHDHYDHLDYRSIRQLAPTGAVFLVPLGVGAHLEAWGIGAERIVELDWWEQHQLNGLTFVATPARHYSGRGVLDLEHTLWCGWAFLGPQHRVFYSGDTAMFPGLRDIGAQLGPFDATLLEAGGYSRHWTDIHLGPEQAVQAHRMLRGDVLLPVHWGLFNLAMHGWTEPVERVLAAAAPYGVRVATPRLGQSFEPNLGVPAERWWPELPWRTAEEDPVDSTPGATQKSLPPKALSSRREVER